MVHALRQSRFYSECFLILDLVFDTAGPYYDHN